MNRDGELTGAAPRLRRAALPVGIWPELRLYAAILEDAHLCLRASGHASAATRAETRAWVEGTIPSAPLCSFREICDMFTLDEAAVRRRLIGGPRPHHHAWPQLALRAAG